jgi:hypothetical protein
MHNTEIPKDILAISGYIQAIIRPIHFLKHKKNPAQSYINLGKRYNFIITF